MKTVCVYTLRLTLSANLLFTVSVSPSLLTAAVTLPPLHVVILVYSFFALLFVVPSPSPAPSLSFALHCSSSLLYLCVFCQRDTGARCPSPTHHCDSHNCLTRENKFYSKSRILMDWAVFFPCHVFSFILVFFLGRCSYADITPSKSIKSSIRKTLQYCTFYWPPHSSLSLLPSLMGRMETSLDSFWLQTREF